MKVPPHGFEIPRDQPGLWICAALWLVCAGCGSAAPGGGASWISGDTDARLEALARHHRGLDVAMVEIGYRYEELYWAGQDGNWEYAAYQVKKIGLALANALERRPKRAESARTIFHPVLAETDRVVQARDASAFAEQFALLTAACNVCHAAEAVPTFRVVTPERRRAPIRWSQ